VDSIYVFGSRASEIAARLRDRSATREHPDSDVDIAIQPSQGCHLNARTRVRLTGALEDLFDADRVDLVLLPEASPFLAVEAIRGELLYCKTSTRRRRTNYTFCGVPEIWRPMNEIVGPTSSRDKLHDTISFACHHRSGAHRLDHPVARRSARVASGRLPCVPSDPRNVASAESYLRRGLEALLDLGRHLLAKGFAWP